MLIYVSILTISVARESVFIFVSCDMMWPITKKYRNFTTKGHGKRKDLFSDWEKWTIVRCYAIRSCRDNVLYQIEWYHVVHGTPDPSSFHCHFWKTAFYSTASPRKRHIIERNTAHICCTETAKNSLSIKIYLLRYYPPWKEANRQSVVLRGAKEPPVSDSVWKTETWNYIRKTRFCFLFML